MTSKELRSISDTLRAWEGAKVHVVLHTAPVDGPLVRRSITTRSYKMPDGDTLVFSGGCLRVRVCDVLSLTVLPRYNLESHSEKLQLSIVVSDYENPRYPSENEA